MKLSGRNVQPLLFSRIVRMLEVILLVVERVARQLREEDEAPGPTVRTTWQRRMTTRLVAEANRDHPLEPIAVVVTTDSQIVDLAALHDRSVAEDVTQSIADRGKRANVGVVTGGTARTSGPTPTGRGTTTCSRFHLRGRGL
jgi:hypothetical protein